MKCTVRILSAIDEKTSLYASNGELFVSDLGFDLSYVMDGETVLLKSANGTISMTRQGDYGLYLPFCEKEITKGLMRVSSSQSGTLDIKTNQAKYSYSDGKLSVLLEYELLFSKNEKQKTTVRINAVLNKESSME